MKKYLLIIFVISLLCSGVYALRAADNCCSKVNCCSKGNCGCTDGKCCTACTCVKK